MAIDSYGNWYPILPEPPPNSGSGFGRWRYGSGVPDNSVGVNGDGWIRTSNGDIYTRNGDVYELQVVGGGGGEAQIIRGTVDDPNVGAIVPDDPSRPAFYYRDSASNDAVQLWRWSVADQLWKELITT